MSRFEAQVAAITKPLASANEMVDAGNVIIMSKEGGVVKMLSENEKKAMNDKVPTKSCPRIPPTHHPPNAIVACIVFARLGILQATKL